MISQERNFTRKKIDTHKALKNIVFSVNNDDCGEVCVF